MFLTMFMIHMLLMPAIMIAEPQHYRLSLNQIYMATAMAAAMMFGMSWTKQSLMLYGPIFLIAVIALRAQIGINESQYLRDMIPHHSMAVLTSEAILAKSGMPQIRQLAQKILTAQVGEIQQMEDLLKSHPK